MFAVSWWGRPDVEGTADTQGVNTDGLIRAVLDAAADVGMKIGTVRIGSCSPRHQTHFSRPSFLELTLYYMMTWQAGYPEAPT